jgi:hypothetical protein
MTMETQRMRTFVGIGALALLAALPLRAAAEVFVDARAGGMGWGLGYGFDVGVNTSDNTSVRLGFTNADRDWDRTYDNVDYTGDYKHRTWSGLVDWRPMSGVFHLTFGLLYADKNDLEISATGTALEIGSGTYNTTLTGRMEYDRDWGPYAGVGWGNMGKKDKGFMWTADLGVAFLGGVNVHLTSSTPVPDSDLRAEEQKLEDDLRFLRWIPMISAAVGWRF